MNTTSTGPSAPLDRALGFLDRHPSTWLALGSGLLVASQMRFGVGVLAWLAPVPFLRHARCTFGWRSRLALAAASLGAWVLATAKIITEPIPLALAVLFALPIGSLLTLPYLLRPLLARRLGERAAVFAFAMLMVTGEWLLHAVLPFGTWGAAANTQLQWLALLQLASITGLHGVSFLVYLSAASWESCLAERSFQRLALTGGVVLASVVVVALGQARLAWSEAHGRARTRVAAVGTDSRVGVGPLPSDARKAAVQIGLFARTQAAARANAALVVWTEASTVVDPQDEGRFLQRVQELARRHQVAIVAGYVVPLSLEPLRYRNRYAFVSKVGRLEHIYDKRQPVPGEPAAPGTGPMPVFSDPELGRVSGALCYDYDFPSLAREHARNHVDLVALPSSDWRGIAPLHTEMAALRAIEGGQSILRSTRYGLSAGIDPWGRTVGRSSHWDGGDRVLVVDLPRRGLRTVYGALGNWFPLLCLASSVTALAVAGLRASSWYTFRLWLTPSFPSQHAPFSKRVSVWAWTKTLFWRKQA